MDAVMRYPKLTIGVDLGDTKSYTCEVDEAAQVVKRDCLPTTVATFDQYFRGRPPCRVVLEVGTHSPWVARHLAAWGHEVIVANGSAVYGKRRRKKRNDRLDAEFLARQGRADVALLAPITHRRAQAQVDLALVRARDQLVRVRTRLINHVRGAVKSTGSRLSRCSAEAFPPRAMRELPAELRPALAPVVATVAELTTRLDAFDRELATGVAPRYPEVARLRRIKGVGPLTALGFVLLLDDPHRFPRSRDVGAFFGLVPRLDESSAGKPQLRITKAGDELGRRLLVNAAQYLLGPFGPPCDLRRYGEALMRHGGGTTAKKRAVVAVARKLAVVMHRLLLTEHGYDPDWQARRRRAA